MRIVPNAHASGFVLVHSNLAHAINFYLVPSPFTSGITKQKGRKERVDGREGEREKKKKEVKKIVGWGDPFRREEPTIK